LPFWLNTIPQKAECLLQQNLIMQSVAKRKEYFFTLTITAHQASLLATKHQKNVNFQNFNVPDWRLQKTIGKLGSP
jgi:hypothetical protein